MRIRPDPSSRIAVLRERAVVTEPVVDRAARRSVAPVRPDPDPADRLQCFLEDNVIDTLNVAGPRKSKEPGIAEFVYRILDQVRQMLMPL